MKFSRFPAVVAMLLLLGPGFAGAGGMSISPSITGISPGLSQRCVQKLGPQAHGAQAARAAHDCRKPSDPQPDSLGSPRPTPVSIPVKQP